MFHLKTIATNIPIIESGRKRLCEIFEIHEYVVINGLKTVICPKVTWDNNIRINSENLNLKI